MSSRSFLFVLTIFFASNRAVASLQALVPDIQAGFIQGRAIRMITVPVCTDAGNYNGIFDCPNRKHLCSDPHFQDLMTIQCAKTCGKCASRMPRTQQPSPCPDVVSDCSLRKHLCNESAFSDLMLIQCGNTCGRCPNMTKTAADFEDTDCVDTADPLTGLSLCSTLSHLCKHPIMGNAIQLKCRKSCGLCAKRTRNICKDELPSSSSRDCSSLLELCNDPKLGQFTRTMCAKTCGVCKPEKEEPCVDLPNPATQENDCPNYILQCMDPNYVDLLTEQCPKTCNKC